MRPIAPLLALLVASCSSDPKGSDAAPETTWLYRARGEAVSVQATVTVEAVDLDKRVVTLKAPEGKSATYRVSDAVQRLPEVKAGDRLAVDYRLQSAFELREPTAEEKASPVAVGESLTRFDPDAPPGATFARSLRAVATIESLDAAAQKVVVKGPQGHTVTAPIKSPAMFNELKVGRSIIVTFNESLTLAVQPK